MENKITKFLAYEKRIAIMCLDTTELVEEIRKIHDLTPTTTAVLGRVATVATMMAHLNLKETTDNLTIQIKGNVTFIPIYRPRKTPPPTSPGWWVPYTGDNTNLALYGGLFGGSILIILLLLLYLRKKKK